MFGVVFGEGDVFGVVEEFVDAGGGVEDGVVAVVAEEHVLGLGGDEEGARGDGGGDVGHVPAVEVAPVGAVAVVVDGAFADVLVEGAGLAGGDDDAEARVGGAGEPGDAAAAGVAGDAEAGGVDVRAGFEVIQVAEGGPDFDVGGGVTLGEPVPAAVGVDAVVEADVFAVPDGVEDEAGVAVGGEPAGVGLVVPFAAGGMAADEDDGGEGGGGGVGGTPEVGSDAAVGEGLEMEFFDGVVGAFEEAGDCRVERGAFGEWGEAEHLSQSWRRWGRRASQSLAEGRWVRQRVVDSWRRAVRRWWSMRGLYRMRGLGCVLNEGLHVSLSEPDIGRLVAALEHRRGDRVPNWEILLDNRCLRHILGMPAEGERVTTWSVSPEEAMRACRLTGQDAILCSMTWGVAEETILTQEDADKIVVPDPREMRAKMQRYLEAVKGTKIGVCARFSGPMTLTYLAPGPTKIETFMYQLYDNRGLVERLMDMFTDYHLRLIEAIKDLPYHFYYIGDDVASTTGLMMSPGDMAGSRGRGGWGGWCGRRRGRGGR